MNPGASSHFLPVRTLLRDRYPLADHLAGVQVPTTVVYGSRDSIVPPETRVVEIAAPTTTICPCGEKLIEAVVELAGRACGASRTSRAHGTPRPSPPPA